MGVEGLAEPNQPPLAEPVDEALDLREIVRDSLAFRKVDMVGVAESKGIPGDLSYAPLLGVP